MNFFNKCVNLLKIFALAILIFSVYDMPFKLIFSSIFSLYLIYELLLSLGKKIPFFELTFVLYAVQILIAPIVEYCFFNNEFGDMFVGEDQYFSFALPAFIALYLGYNVFNNQHKIMNEMQFFVNRKKEFESIGFFLLKIGVFFYIISLFYSDFIVEVLAFLRLLGIFYLYLARSLKWRFYFLVILGIYLVESIISTIFINVIILLILVYFIFNLNKVVSKIKLLAFSSVVFILIVVMQSTKGDFRSLAWVEGNTIDYSFGEMYLNSITNLNTDNFKSMAQNLNHRVNHGAIISQGMNHLDVKENLDFLKSEIIGILFPRFIYADKAVVGSHDKFEYFTGTKLNDGVAFNVGIFGDAYLALGPVIGIIFVFLVGFLFSLVYANYCYNLNKYPDLIVWSILIFFMVMRAGNEFYIIFNWIVKTGFFTVFFFKLIRPYFIKE